MAEKVKVIKLADGTVTNLVDKKTKLSVNYKPVTTYYDGSAMTNAKVDGDLYIKNGTTFYRKVIDKDGELFLEKDTMAQMRALTSFEILLLKAGVYKGVKLNGYYAKGDTPSPIEYVLSTTLSTDDGGSVIAVGDVKLEHDFVGNLDVRYFGVFDDGVERTAIINIVLEYAKGKNIVDFTGGDYLINSTNASSRGVILPSNTKINTSVHTVFRSTPQSVGSYAVFYSRDSKNISINRLVIYGERGSHTGTSGEWGMGLSLNTCENVDIGYLECNDCWGDGLYLGKITVGSTNKDITIDYFKANNNRRQGISIITGRNVLINGAYISNTAGALPEAGIDIEPNHPEDELSLINLNNINTYNNKGGGITFVSLQSNETTPIVDITINNHKSLNELGFTASGARTGLVKGEININNFKSQNAPITSMIIRNYTNQPDLNINNPVIINPNQTARTDEFGSGIYISREGSDSFVEGSQHPFINIVNPTVKSYDLKMRRGIHVFNSTGNVLNKIRNVSIKNPYILGANASPLLYESDLDVIDDLDNAKRVQVGADYVVNSSLNYTTFVNTGSSANIRVRLGTVQHNSGSKLKILVDSPSNFGASLLNGGYFRNLGSSYSNISSNVVGNYIVIRCVDPVLNLWDIVQMVGNWTSSSGGVINTLPRKADSSLEGIVKQSATVAFPNVNPLPATDAASTATDIAGVVADLNDLITKYNSLRSYSAENRTSITNKLTADRASGQQAT